MTCSFPIGDQSTTYPVPGQTFPVLVPARMGWICPVCKRGNSPDAMQCPCHCGIGAGFTFVITP